MVANFQSKNSPTVVYRQCGDSNYWIAGFPFACFHSLVDLEMCPIFDIKKKPVKSHVNMLQHSKHLSIMNTTTCMGDMCVGWTSTKSIKTGSHTSFYNTCNETIPEVTSEVYGIWITCKRKILDLIPSK